MIIATGRYAAEGDGAGAIVGDFDGFGGAGRTDGLSGETKLGWSEGELGLGRAAHIYELWTVVAGVSDCDRSVDFADVLGSKTNRDGAVGAGAQGASGSWAGIGFAVIAARRNSAHGNCAATGIGHSDALAGAGTAGNRLLESERCLAERKWRVRAARTARRESDGEWSAIAGVIGDHDGAIGGGLRRLHLDADRATGFRVESAAQARARVHHVVAAGGNTRDGDRGRISVGDLEGLGTAERSDRHRTEGEAGGRGAHWGSAAAGQPNQGEQVVIIVVDAGRARNRARLRRRERNFQGAGTTARNTAVAVIRFAEVAAHDESDGLRTCAGIRDRHTLRCTRNVDHRF